MPPYQSTARLFKALMHPGRLAILNILRDGEKCVCHLEAVLGCRQAYISQHLMTLREAGIVMDRREGARIYYRVVKPEIFALIDTANQLAGGEHWQTPPAVVKGCLCPQCDQEEHAVTEYPLS